MFKVCTLYFEYCNLFIRKDLFSSIKSWAEHLQFCIIVIIIIIIIVVVIIIIIIINFILIQGIGFTEPRSNWKTFTGPNSAQLPFLYFKVSRESVSRMSRILSTDEFCGAASLLDFFCWQVSPYFCNFIELVFWFY